MDKNVIKIADELKLSSKYVEATVALLDEGATVPFICRYRKEVTGAMDEVEVSNVRDRIGQLRELDERRATILKAIAEQGKLTDELKTKIEEAETMAILEDIYLPYKPKRRTRATIAREKGLEPLADLLFLQEDIDIQAKAAEYISEEKGVLSVEEALAGARDIIAEKVNEDQEARQRVRRLFEQEGLFIAKVIEGKEEEGQKYRDYFDWKEPIKAAPSHRILAMRRAEKEGIISLDCAPEEEKAIEILENLFVKNKTNAADQVSKAVKDAYKRLLKPSIETEIRVNTKLKADIDAIRVFTDNLRQLLLAPPLGQKNVLALDPGFRSGCKLVVLNKQGKLLHNDVIYPHEPQRKIAEAISIIKKIVNEYQIEAISIGNGTAGRETEAFIKDLGLPKEIKIIVVNESGASVYSASEVARDEFPDYDLTVRGAVSIGRRLMDPLAELVKIDPKAIGVGQYQHDVDQALLKISLDDTVESCVNAVGVEVNTASKQLLTYVSGIGPSIAENIIKYRNENGPFDTRDELKKVPRLGAKAFEQAAGFLRIREAKNPLDMSAVHPESYHIVEKMAQDLQCSVKDLMTNEALRNSIKLEAYITEKAGLPTLQDIMKELAKPGRDPRQQFEDFQFAEGISKPEDLRVGMKVPGIVTNITDFGAFVDIGVHQDGLVHISQMANRRINHPNEVVKVQQKVEVTVTEVDLARKRIALSMKEVPAAASSPKTSAATPTGKVEKTLQKPKNTPSAPKPKKEVAKDTPRTEEELSMAEKLNLLKLKFK
jgi:uncharacterized protein